MAITTNKPAEHAGLLKVTALDSFMHGRLEMVKGQTETIEAGEARELEKIGLVKTAKVKTTDAEPVPEGVDDLLEDDTKMDDAPKNKMDDAPANKNTKTKAK